ncbi:MAG TPA: lysylphosphatidylglycerol synthase transmembrane domain-containing protein [Thermomicrobiales bacterium]|nr:lysylphosphatidylglycerol synthase transmembrane domain-containing protein [Thermomicrobiales bacterium]
MKAPLDPAMPPASRHSRPDRREWGLPLVFLVACAVALIGLNRTIELRQFWLRIWEINVPLVCLACGLYLVSLVLLCQRWHLLVAALKPTARRRSSYTALTTSLMVNYASPGSLGVPARALLTNRQEQVPFAGLVPLALFEALLDIAVLAGYSVFACVLAGPAVLSQLITELASRITFPSGLIWFSVGGVALIILALFILAVWWLRRRHWRRLQTAKAAVALVRQRSALIWQITGLTLAFWAAQIGIMGVLVRSVEVHGVWQVLPAFTTIPLLIGMIVPVPGGAGVREALLVVMAGSLGISLAGALVVALLYRLLLFVADPLLFVCIRLFGRPPRTGPAIRDDSWRCF